MSTKTFSEISTESEDGHGLASVCESGALDDMGSRSPSGIARSMYKLGNLALFLKAVRLVHDFPRSWEAFVNDPVNNRCAELELFETDDRLAFATALLYKLRFFDFQCANGNFIWCSAGKLDPYDPLGFTKKIAAGIIYRNLNLLNFGNEWNDLWTLFHKPSIKNLENANLELSAQLVAQKALEDPRIVKLADVVTAVLGEYAFPAYFSSKQFRFVYTRLIDRLVGVIIIQNRQAECGTLADLKVIWPSVLPMVLDRYRFHTTNVIKDRLLTDAALIRTSLGFKIDKTKTSRTRKSKLENKNVFDCLCSMVKKDPKRAQCMEDSKIYDPVLAEMEKIPNLNFYYRNRKDQPVQVKNLPPPVAPLSHSKEDDSMDTVEIVEVTKSSRDNGSENSENTVEPIVSEQTSKPKTLASLNVSKEASKTVEPVQVSSKSKDEGYNAPEEMTVMSSTPRDASKTSNNGNDSKKLSAESLKEAAKEAAKEAPEEALMEVHKEAHKDSPNEVPLTAKTFNDMSDVPEVALMEKLEMPDLDRDSKKGSEVVSMDVSKDFVPSRVRKRFTRESREKKPKGATKKVDKKTAQPKKSKKAFKLHGPVPIPEEWLEQRPPTKNRKRKLQDSVSISSLPFAEELCDEPAESKPELKKQKTEKLPVTIKRTHTIITEDAHLKTTTRKQERETITYAGGTKNIDKRKSVKTFKEPINTSKKVIGK